MTTAPTERWANRVSIAMTKGRKPPWASELNRGRHESVIFNVHVFIKHLSYSAGVHRAATQIKTIADWMSWIPMIYDIVRYFTNLPSCILIVFWRSLSLHLNGFVINACGYGDLPNCVFYKYFIKEFNCTLDANISFHFLDTSYNWYKKFLTHQMMSESEWQTDGQPFLEMSSHLNFVIFPGETTKITVLNRIESRSV